MTTLPSAAQQRVQPSPPIWTVAMQVLLRTSQNLHVPSLDTDASSASLIGFHPTATIPPVCPRSSVLLPTLGLSGFHTRSVRSAEPVAIRAPDGFQAIERILSSCESHVRSLLTIDVAFGNKDHKQSTTKKVKH